MRLGALVDRYAKWILPIPAVLFVVVMMIFPILFTVRNSLTGWSLGEGVQPVITGFQNYSKLLTSDTRFWESAWRTLYFTGLALTVELVLGVALALLLNREFKGKNLVKTLFLLPMVATPVAVGMVFLLMYEPTAGVMNFTLSRLGLPAQMWVANEHTVIPALALVDIWQWTPMVTLIVQAGLAGLPQDPFEAAKVDGASRWQITSHITLPLLAPTITTAGIMRAIDALKTFDIIYTMTGGGPGFSSNTINIYAYETTFRYFNFGYASSILIMFLAVVLGVTLLANYARKGWEA